MCSGSDSGWGVLEDWVIGSNKYYLTKYLGCSFNQRIEIKLGWLSDYSIIFLKYFSKYCFKYGYVLGREKIVLAGVDSIKLVINLQ